MTAATSRHSGRASGSTNTSVSGASVGRAELRREDPALLRGRGRYVDDITIEGMLHARFVRSPFAHARIRSVDVDAARRLDGVVGVFTAADLALAPLLPPIDTEGVLPVPRPMLAADQLRFVGEAYAVVLAESPYIAEDAADLVGLEAEQLPAVVDPLAAVAPNSVAVHEQHGTNVLYERNFFSEGFEAAKVEEAPIKITRTFDSPRQTALPMEPRGIVVNPLPDILQVWASTQSPHMVAQTISEHLALDPASVHVVVPDVGGGFGQKAHVYPEDVVVAAVARRVGRPVKWVEDRLDNLSSACHARDQQVTLTIAADADGHLLALDADVAVDMGAYGVHAHGHLLEPNGTPTMIPGPYRLPAYRFRTRAIATNKCPLGAYRGVGLPVATFVHERAMDLIASATGVDRAEVRRRNVITPDELPYTSLTGQRYDSGDYPAALQQALDAIGYDTFRERQEAGLRDGRVLGLGVALYVEYSAVNSAVFRNRGMLGLKGFDEAHATLQGNTLRIRTTLPSAGQGLTTTFGQLAADEFGIPFERVIVEPVDTSVGGLDGNGTFASRSAVSGGGAVQEACRELRSRLIHDAAEWLEAAPQDIDMSDGLLHVVGSPGSQVSVEDLQEQATAERYTVTERHDPPAVVYPYGAHACTVEIDPRTGHVTVSKYVVVEDCGKVINPMIVLGQVHGAVAQGVAGALYESIIYDETGQLQTASLMDYLVPTASEIMPMEVHHMHVPVRDSATGAKGVGESGTLAPGAVIANAISDALDRECNRMPPTNEWLRDTARARLQSAGELTAKSSRAAQKGAEGYV